MGILRTVLALAGLGFALWSPAAFTAPKEPPKTPDFWTRGPSRNAFMAAWPEAARKQGSGGRAAMRCGVDSEGALKDCKVILDRPSGAGFGAALLSLAPHYRRNLADYPGTEAVVVEDWFEIDTPPDWVKRPSAWDILSVFPSEALKAGRSGDAVISCLVTAQGALDDCVPVWESPAGMGFGRAAVALTAQFAMKPATRGGKPAPSVARIPIRFKTYGRADTSMMKRVAPAELAWAEAPAYADVVAAYPAKARAENIGGKAVVACEMRRDGRLEDCLVHSETPRGKGLGEAARKLARRFRLEVSTEEERRLTDDLVVHLPVVFDPAMLSDQPPVVGRPSWASLPTADDLKGAMDGLKAGQTVRVVLACVVQPGGTLDGCKVVSEEPAGLGAGQAALGMSPKFRLTTWTSEGLPTIGGTVRIPLRFEP